MLNFFYNIFFKDIKLKLMSLMLAIGLWFISVNFTDPVEIRNYEVFLEIASDLAYLRRYNVMVMNESDIRARVIVLSLRGTKSELDLLNDRNIIATLDVRALDTSIVDQSDILVDYSASVLVDVLPGFEIVNRWPNSVELVLDQRVRHNRNIQFYVTGEPAEGHVVHSQSASNSMVTISGARSLVDRVQTVQVQTNAHDAHDNFERLEPIRAFDEDSIDITDTVELSIETTLVTVEIFPYKSIDLEYQITGVPAAGYTMTELIKTPDAINIIGTENALNRITAINVATINLGNLNESQTFHNDIRQYLPSGVYLRGDENSSVMVEIIIEQEISKEYQINVEDITILNLQSHLELSYVNNEAIIALIQGAVSYWENFNEFNDKNISVELDLLGVEEGGHNLPLVLSIPNGFVLIDGPPYIEVILETNETTEADGNNYGNNEEHNDE